MRVASIVFSCFAIVLLTVSPINAAAVALYPRDIRGAYNVNPLLQSGYTGKGVTVAIVNTGIDGTFYTSVKGFSSVYGLPDPTISVVRPYGSAGTDHETPDGETTADAELVHAMAPDAHILLVLVGTGGNLLDGFPYVIDHNAADIAVLSPSEYYWGTNARDTVESYNGKYAKSVGEKITLIAASNDWGSDNTDPWGEISGDFWTKHLPDSYLMPQYNPYVTAVGGTILTVQSMSYGSEKGWERSGGGPSNLFTQPTWQKGSGVPENGFRNIPDIALNAACETAYVVYWNVSQGTFCGTSGAAPTFAGIIADITQAAGERLGFLNPTLYSLASSDPSVYHEITSGCSLLKPNPNDPATKTGYCAHAGWNFVTGLGSIDATRLATHLAPRAHIVPATTTTTTSREHSTESTSIIRESRTESTASTNQSNVKGFEYLPYILAGLAVAALVIVGFTYARKRTTKTHSG
jgi:subtilase family serine protease